MLKLSTLISLSLFSDNCGLFRICGHLRNTNLPVEFPIPSKYHPVTHLLVKFYYLKFLHAGVQLINIAVKQMYWIVGAKSVIHKEVRKCITCAQFRSEFSKQIMANLPSSRVNPDRSLLICSMDFCRPFLISHRFGRELRPLKLYACIFICFSTKAEHFELVGDLSTIY